MLLLFYKIDVQESAYILVHFLKNIKIFTKELQLTQIFAIPRL